MQRLLAVQLLAVGIVLRELVEADRVHPIGGALLDEGHHFLFEEIFTFRLGHFAASNF